MNRWVKNYTDQVDMINTFYKEKFKQYLNDFDSLQIKYQQKLDYEHA